MHGCRCKGVRSAVEHTTAAGRGGPFVRFASGLSSPGSQISTTDRTHASPGCMLETITYNLEFYALMARRTPRPSRKRYIPPARPRAPSCVEGGVADSPARVPRGCSTVVPHTQRTPADARRILAKSTPIFFDRVGAVSPLVAAVGCGRCGAVVGLGVCGASGVAPQARPVAHPAPKRGQWRTALDVRCPERRRQHPDHASVKTASSFLEPMSVFLPPRASVACMVGAAAAHSQPPAAAMPAWSPCLALAPVRPPK